MRFYRWYWLYFVISALFLVPGIISLCLHGLRPGIDFTGGSIVTVQTVEASRAGELTETYIRDHAGRDMSLSSVKRNDLGQAIIRTATLTNEDKNQLLEALSTDLPVEQVSFESVGATLGRELIVKTFVAIALASLVLVLYLYYRFHELTFGLGALLGVVHDVTIICGLFSIFGVVYGMEVDTLFVTAMLTTISFSVHDTVVIYDRLRELRKIHPGVDLTSLCEAAVTATFSRSLNNSLTVVFMLASLLLLGGASLREFALALLLGVVFGTYSSPFTSVPLLILFDKKHWFTRKK
ncbi:protein translocase subunit SecF [bacterium]|nr:protein translocase subunit SecF [bacterium]